jgi:hypothetical protein
LAVSKFERFVDYPGGSLSSAEAALLTVWPTLIRYHDSLVLVGGLAVHYLTRRDLPGLPGAMTIDVDFGVTLGASGGQYGTIQSDLRGLGFKSYNNRLVRKHGDTNLYLDFLTEDPPAVTGSRIVDDVTASVIPGLNRALQARRLVSVRGTDLYGAEKDCEIYVADIGPLLVLKLNAFGGPTGRRLPKDAYDIVLLVTGFVEGPGEAVEAFQREAEMKNSGYASARRALEMDFAATDRDGPIRAAEFLPGTAADRERMRQQAVTVCEMLLGR